MSESPIALAAWCVLTAFLSACTPAPPRSRAFPQATSISPQLTVATVAPAAHVITDLLPFPANSLFVELPANQLLLIDTPYTARSTRDLLAWIDDHFPSYSITAINTHFHPDRLGGNAELLARHIPIYGSDLTATLLAERGEAVRAQMLTTLRAQPELAAEFQSADWHAPDHRFPISAGLDLRVGAETVRLIYPGPGHTPDNIVVWFPDRGILFAGCLVFTGPKPGNTVDAVMSDWPASLRSLLALHPRIVVPGHGPPGGEELITRAIDMLENAP